MMPGYRYAESTEKTDMIRQPCQGSGVCKNDADRMAYIMDKEDMKWNIQCAKTA